jgi:hypothetical protein
MSNRGFFFGRRAVMRLLRLPLLFGLLRLRRGWLFAIAARLVNLSAGHPRREQCCES